MLTEKGLMAFHSCSFVHVIRVCCPCVCDEGLGYVLSHIAALQQWLGSQNVAWSSSSDASDSVVVPVPQYTEKCCQHLERLKFVSSYWYLRVITLSAITLLLYTSCYILCVLDNFRCCIRPDKIQEGHYILPVVHCGKQSGYLRNYAHSYSNGTKAFVSLAYHCMHWLASLCMGSFGV